MDYEGANAAGVSFRTLQNLIDSHMVQTDG
jgi:hypothetical protein